MHYLSHQKFRLLAYWALTSFTCRFQCTCLLWFFLPPKVPAWFLSCLFLVLYATITKIRTRVMKRKVLIKAIVACCPKSTSLLSLTDFNWSVSGLISAESFPTTEWVSSDPLSARDSVVVSGGMVVVVFDVSLVLDVVVVFQSATSREGIKRV